MESVEEEEKFSYFQPKESFFSGLAKKKQSKVAGFLVVANEIEEIFFEIRKKNEIIFFYREFFFVAFK